MAGRTGGSREGGSRASGTLATKLRGQNMEKIVDKGT